MARLAVSLATGAALAPLFGRLAFAPLLFFLPLAPIRAWLRPPGARALLVAYLAGAVAALAVSGGTPCAPVAHGGARARLRGHFLAANPGHTAPFAVTAGACRGEARVLVPDRPVEPGRTVRVTGRWREAPQGVFLVADSVAPDPSAPPSLSPSLSRALVRWRGGLARRIQGLYGERAPLVSALTLARKEGLDPELREAFARSGLSHLLAISGFHVGVIALLLLTALRRVGLRRRGAALAAAAGTWGYVALLGFPDAACRAAVILSAVAASHLRGRPPARWGPLGVALLLLLVLDPRRLASPGFQLSFAGAAGLASWAPGLRDALTRGSPRLPRGLASAVAAGCAATLATLPIAAWHFERVSLVGIPATLLVSPLVAFALPGALASLAADGVHHGAGLFLAGGVDVALDITERLTRFFATPAWASLWLPRTWVPVAAVGAWAAVRVASRSRMRARTRRAVGALGACAAVAVWPVLLGLQGRGSVTVVAVDVGQGDAIAVRSPGGRWILVDAGPPWPGDPGAAPVVRTLRRLGVHRLELLVLTHPDLDHVGSAGAVLASFAVGAVLEPSRPTGKEVYVDLVAAARARGVPWRRAQRGQRFDLDGMSVEILSPGPPGEAMADDATESNAVSVVMVVRYGALDVLLTGDAPVSVERAVVDRVGPSLEVLKVGHHGSATSTDSLLLARTHPGVALLSVGRGNRYGHPAPAVLARLRRFGVEIRRTDREGTLTVLGRRDGSFTVEGAGGPRR